MREGRYDTIYERRRKESHVFCENLGLLLEDYFVAGLKYDVKSILVAAEMKNRFVSSIKHNSISLLLTESNKTE